MYIEDYKKIRLIRWGIFYIFSPLLKLEHILYKMFNKNPKKIKRLIATTGNISLINALAIINEIKDFEKYEDYLVIDTGKGRKAFVENNKKIASLHNFKKIFVGYQTAPGITALFNNFYKVDELYLVNHPGHIKTLVPFFTKAKITLIDEGFGSLIKYDIKTNDPVKFKTRKYIGKLDSLGFKDSPIVFEDMNLEEFKNIALKVENMAPLQIKTSSDEKTILYCGIYWEVSGLDKKHFEKIQNEIVENLIKAGYKILYKPHPRDKEFFGLDKNPAVEFIESKFPLEIYNPDVIATVSVSSTCSIAPAHYHGIPGFCHVLDEAFEKYDKNAMLNITRYIVKEYSPDYQELLKLDVKNLSKEQLKKEAKRIYFEYINSKPLLSQNTKILEYFENQKEGKKNDK